jgi:hypothetical protein
LRLAIYIGSFERPSVRPLRRSTAMKFGGDRVQAAARHNALIRTKLRTTL